jgi:hypothetical protein
MPDATAGKVPIIACVRSSWLFLAQNIRPLLPAAAICALLSQIGAAATLLTASAGQAASANIVTFVPGILAGLMYSAAVLRKAVRDEFVSPVGLTLGRDEGRLFGLSVSVFLIGIPIVFLLSMLLFGPIMGRIAPTPEAAEALAQDPEALAKAFAEALGPGGVLAVEIGGILLYCLVLGLVTFMQAATIGEKRIVLFQALRWTGGNLFRVLAAIVLTILPVSIITAVVTLGGGALIVDVLTYLLVTTVIAFIGNIVAIPIAALGAVLYKGLRPPDFVAK